MAQNVSKVYRIDIQLDKSRQALADANKKLRELDASLEGMDRNSDAAKAIVAQMAALAAQVDQAEGNVDGLSEALDNLKPGTIPALEAEIEELEAAFRRTVVGTAEFDKALTALGKKKGELKSIEDAIDALDPKEKAAAFADFANGVVGAFAIATTAAQTFGLSKEAAEEYQNKLLGLMTVMDGVEQVSRALNSETLSVVKSAVASGKAFFGMGEAAATGSKVARVALASTGIGLLVVLLGTLYSLWEDFGTTVKGSESSFTKWKGTVMGSLGAALSVLKDFLKYGYQLATLDFSGAQKTAAEAGTKAGKAFTDGRAAVIDEARRKELAHDVEKNKLMVEVLKARGQDTLALEVAIAKQNLAAQKRGSQEALEALAAYIVLRIQLQKRAQDDEQASRLVFLNGLAAAEAARGADSFKQQLAAKKQQIADLNQAAKEGEYVSQAQRLALDNELRVLLLARDKELADRRAALQSATLNAELARLQARGREGLTLIQSQAAEELALAQRLNAQKTAIAEQNLKTLRSQAQVDQAAVVAANAELATLGIEAEQLAGQKRIVAIQEQGALMARARAAVLESAERREQQHQDVLNAMQAAGARVSKKIADDLANETKLKAMKADADADLWGNLLIKVFGLTDEQAQKLKARLVEVAAQVGNLTAALLQGATADADAALTTAQTRLSEISQQLNDATQRRQADESALQDSAGARRDYLLMKIAKEQAAEQKLAAEKAKAAREEQQAQKEKAKLDKVQNEITAATSAVEAVLLGIKAAKAVVEAASHGKIGYDNIALAIAAAVAIGASIVSVKNASKFANGGLVDGPSHAAGGVQMWHASGAHLGEMEGGEYIINKRSAAANRPLLDMINDMGNTRVLPHPSGRFAAGGIVSGAGTVPIAAADLSELLEINRALLGANQQMLAHLQSIGAATAQTAAFGPPVLEFGYDAELRRQALQQGMDQSESFVTLGG